MNTFRKLFLFNQRDRNTQYVLVAIMMACIILWPFFGDEEDRYSNSKDKPSYRHKDGGRAMYYAVPDQTDKVRLFPFDPNTADSTQLLSLGLKPWQVRSIYRYRAKGGRFRKPTDFARLYGLTLKQYKQLEPYIRIVPEPMARDYYGNKEAGYGNREAGYGNREAGYGNKGSNQQGKTENPYKTASHSSQPTPSYEHITKLHPGETVDINTADTTFLKRIPGIGSYFARRIVELRQRKGMFVSPEQLLTIRNFPEYSLTYMTASQNFPSIRINHATFKELHAHPLLDYTQASDIIRMRRTSGSIRSVKDLSLIPSISPEQLERLTPLLNFE